MQELKMSKLATDIGSGNLKAVKGLSEKTGDSKIIHSIVTPYPEEEIFQLDKNQYIAFGGKKYLVGDDAFYYGDPAKRFETVSDDWHGTEQWFALLYSAIAEMFEPSVSHIHLGTGLPQKLFSKKKEELRSKLDTRHKFTVNGKKYNVTIKAEIVPQASGALLYCAYLDESILDERVGVIDFGTHTTGLSIIEEGRFIEHKSTGIAKGANILYQYISKRLKSEIGLLPDMAKMPGIVKTGKIKVRREDVDVTHIVQDCAQQLYEEMIPEINDAWGNTAEYNNIDDMRVLVSGGAGPVFYNAVKKHISHAEQTSEEGRSESVFDVSKGIFAYIDSMDSED